jgi:hypothetical protein
MDKNQRKIWNENHKRLKEIIEKQEHHVEAIQLFLSQHSLLHSASIGHSPDQATMEDELLNDIYEATFRQYPVKTPDTQNSIAWHIWHVTRIEDMAMNILVANEHQVLTTDNWLEKLNIPFEHSGNDMSEEEIASLSANIDYNSLRAYRTAVGKRTQEVISNVRSGQFQQPVSARQINRLFEEKAVSENSKWLADYWSKKTIAGLVLMPGTRHIFLHLNKCLRIKTKYQKKV